MPRDPSWTDAELTAAVTSSVSLGEVCRRLGLRPGGGTYATLRRHIGRLVLDVERYPAVRDGRVCPPRSWTDDDLRSVVTDSRSVAEVQRRLGYEPSGGMHRAIAGHIRRLDLSTEHFVGQAWARGTAGRRGLRAFPLSEILVANSAYTSSAGLRRRLIRAGLKQPRCERCGIDSWLDEPIPLHLDHVNGDPQDNRLANLRILCPNCHALTDTWCGRNRRPAYSNR